MLYKIFGTTVSITSENKDLGLLIRKEMECYPLSEEAIEVEVNFVNKITLTDVYSNSPSIHSSFREGFLASYGKNRIIYSKKDILKIDVEISKRTNTFKDKLVKFINIGFKNNIEEVGAILHELVFVVMNYFFINKALIHASSMKNRKTEKVILFGGTGGVGKTSLELLLCRKLGYSFISDDIAVIDKDCNIYPNLAHPKIYAYNVEGNADLENLLFSDKNYYDKFQWKVLKKLRGLNKVRRSISPSKIYQSVEKDRNMMDEYYILSRNNLSTNIEIEEISANEASIMTLKIIQNEYHAFTQHIVWHEYNAMLLKNNPILVLEDIHKNWLDIYQEVFKNIKCFNIKIPINFDQKEFLRIFQERF